MSNKTPMLKNTKQLLLFTTNQSNQEINVQTKALKKQSTFLKLSERTHII